MKICWFCGCRPWLIGRRAHDAVHRLIITLALFEQDIYLRADR